MKVAMITGSYPPDVCGGGDYTERLVRSLQDRGVLVEVITGPGWRIRDVPAVLHRIAACAPDVTHIQYPTVGYGHKFGPHIVALLERGVVTLHEASQTHFLRRLSLYPLLLSRHVIFTNRFEQAYVSRFAPWLSRRSSVIPIGSNIPAARADGGRRQDEIVYFGLIRPAKGLEKVLELAAILKQRGTEMTVRIVGRAMSEHQAYLDALRAKSESLPVIWEIGSTDSATAERLARAAFAYAPFPDGASERRGSLLALLANGVATVTTRGAQTPKTLDEVVEFSASPTDAVSIFEGLKADSDRRQALSRKGMRYASQYSWSAIADLHIKVYRALAKQRRTQVA